MTTGASRRNATLVAAGILLSRVSGFARARAVSHFLGTSFAVDAFNAALRIPNILQNLLGEGVLSASFIPVYSRLLAEGRDEEAGRVAGAVAGLLTAVTGALVVVGVLFAEPIAAVIAAGYTGQKFALTVTLVRILTPGIGFLVLSAWALGVLNSHRRFFLSYVAPVLWNAAQIAAVVGLGVVLGPGADTLRRLAVGLALGAVVGGALQLAVQVPAVLRLSPGLRPSLDTRLPAVRRTLRAFGPVVAGRGVVQLSAFVDTLLVSFLATGGFAVLGYAQLLYLLPISLFGMSVAAAALPEFSTTVDREALREGVDEGSARVGAYVVPTVVAYLVIGDLIVGALFQTGRFDRVDTVAVWAVLAGYATGLLASTTSRTLQSALYGLGKPATPARVGAVRVLVSAALGAALMFPLDRVAVLPGGLAVVGELVSFTPVPEWLREAAVAPPRLGPVGLALGAGAGAWVEYALLRRATARALGATRLGGGVIGRTLLAALAAGAVGLLARPVVGGLDPLLAGPLAAVLFGSVYLAAASRLGVPEAQALLTHLPRLRSRRGR